MRYQIICIAFFLWCPFAVLPAFALSDAEYAVLAKEFPAFSQAETRLNAAWKQLKAALPKAEYQKTLEEQRAWLQNRDKTVNAQAANAPPATKAALYAAETVKRAELLETRLANNCGDQSDITGEYGNTFGTIEIRTTSQGYSAFLNTSAPGDAHWVCNFLGDGQRKGDVLAILFGEGAEADILRIKVQGQSLSIGKDLNPQTDMTSFCGSGGSIDGTYSKK